VNRGRRATAIDREGEMGFRLRATVFVMMAMLVLAGPARAHEFTGFIQAEGRLFTQSAIHEEQKDLSGSLALQPEYYHEFEDGSSFTLVPFYRIDTSDPERTHFDLREFTYLGLREDFELRLGVRKVFWGTAEVYHLVDVLNQTDLVENVDTEDKLGQPMVNLSLPGEWGTLDVFVLPYFRERTFPGKAGRLRGAAVVDTGRTQFESGAKEWHTDWALRYFKVLGEVDLGFAHFVGTGREPTLLDGKDGNGNPIKIPLYEQIHQTSLDLSYVAGGWLWKAEALYRAGQGDRDYFAWTGGFEYTFYGIADTALDLGILLEGMYDERGSLATTAFQSDIVAGLRLAVNDPQSTEVLVGWLQDTENASRGFFLEASRRLGNRWKLAVEIRADFGQPASDFLFDQRADDFMQIELNYYF